MRTISILIGLVALPAFASAQTAQVEVDGEVNGSGEGGIEFVDSSEVEVVVDDSGREVRPPPPAQAPPPPPQAQGGARAQVQVTLPQPPQVQLQISDQRQLLRARLAQYPLGGPIALTVVGIPVAAVFGLAAYYAWHVEDAVDCFDGVCDDDPNRVATAVLGTIAGVGLVLG